MALDDDLFLVIFLLAVIYGAVLLFAIIRTFKLHTFGPEWTHTKVFYALLLLHTVIRMLSFLAFMLTTDIGREL
jgi:hypothetical protein